MVRRSIAFGVVASLVAAASWWACSGKESASPSEDGGADAGGTGALGGAATGGTSPTGGKGGTGGSVTDAGEWGLSPMWESIPGTAVGCTFERMTNAASVRFLRWEPCSWTKGCEQAVFNRTTLLGKTDGITPTSNVVDDGTTVRAGFSTYWEHRMALVVGDDGMGLDAIRVTGGKPDCEIFGPSVWKQRFAIHVQDPDVKHFGGILGDVGAMNSSPIPFTIPEPPPSGSPQQLVLGEDRWLWWWTPVDRFSTVSSKDGSEFQIFAKVSYSSSVVAYSVPATTGPLFLAQEYEVMDGGHVQGKIAYSDGVSPMKPYLVPENLNDDYSYPAFANTHVGFMKGISQKNVNVYDSVEIWATPYSTNPSELKPELVAQHALKSASKLAGGWGRLATVATLPPDGKFGMGIWTLAKKSARTYPIPDDYKGWQMLGLTRAHLWLAAESPTAGGNFEYLMRFKVE